MYITLDSLLGFEFFKKYVTLFLLCHKSQGQTGENKKKNLSIVTFAREKAKITLLRA